MAGSLTKQSKAQTAHIRTLGWPVFELDSQTIFDRESQEEAEQQLIRQLRQRGLFGKSSERDSREL